MEASKLLHVGSFSRKARALVRVVWDRILAPFRLANWLFTTSALRYRRGRQRNARPSCGKADGKIQVVTHVTVIKCMY